MLDFLLTALLCPIRFLNLFALVQHFCFPLGSSEFIDIFLIRGHPFMTSTQRARGVRFRWTHVDGGGGQAPCGRPHRKLKIESTDAILSSSHAKKLLSTACGRPQGGSGSCGQGGQKSDFFVDVLNGWPLSGEEFEVMID